MPEESIKNQFFPNNFKMNIERAVSCVATSLSRATAVQSTVAEI
jgi:hypothetical protein